MTLTDPSQVSLLEPLSPEGLYRVTEAFYCCEQKCKSFEPELLVELGYNAEGRPIVFVPELVEGQLAIPSTGTAIDLSRLTSLKQLKVTEASTGTEAQSGSALH